MTLLMRDQEMMRKGMQQGLQQGMKQGMQQGTMSTLFSLVEDGILTIDVAAARVHMEPEEFKEAMEQSKSVSA